MNQLIETNGLSILIPIYNFDCFDLVNELYQQCQQSRFPFEIICLDDASTNKFNQIVSNLGIEVTYQHLRENVGRSRIRNLLAQKAKFEYLLFLDCDSKVVRSDFVEQYIQTLNSDILLYGGRVYNQQKPPNEDFTLHWTYGHEREELSASARTLQPYHSFMTNNFVIPKAIFHQIRFDETLNQYGHEDTLFGMELKARAILILHLDNPLEHIGLEKAAIFLAKTDLAIENLAQLHQDGKLVETKLLKAYQRLKKYRWRKIYLFVYRQFKSFLKQNLMTPNPRLFYFDLYKLERLTEEMLSLEAEDNLRG